MKLAALPPNPAVYLYGSRARGDHRWNSDFDLWIKGVLPAHILSEIEEALEESFVPFKVDIVIGEQLTGQFAAEVKRDAILWM